MELSDAQAYGVYKGTEHGFGFISYSHADIKKVEHIFKILVRNGIRIWYDQMGDGIPAGTGWEESINERLLNSAVFLCFLSNGVENRSEVMREIRMAAELRDKRSDFKMIFIFLERVPVTIFPPEIQDLINGSQYIMLHRYGGITEKFVNRLVNPEIWSDDCVDEEYRSHLGLPPWDRIQKARPEFWAEAENVENPYIYDRILPEKKSVDGHSFYCLTTNEIDQSTVYPLCLDNQWIPTSLLSDPRFLQEGILEPGIAAEIRKRQEAQLIRALIHNFQIVVNRASIQNSKIFIDWYYGKDGQVDPKVKEAFIGLLENGSIAIYLYGEDVPWGKGDYATDDGAGKAYVDLCQNHEVFCVKLNWDNPDYNRYLTNKKIAMRFHTTCVNLADDAYGVESLVANLNIPPEKADEFRGILRKAQADAIENSMKENNLYSREKFYKRRVIVDETEANCCILSPDKPFSRELKQIADFSYGINLPDALGIWPVFEADDPLRRFYEEEGEKSKNLREVSADEVVCAIAQYKPGFVGQPFPQPVFADPGIYEVYKIRALSSWKEYIRTVLSGKKRATENDIDLYDIDQTFRKYRALLEEIHAKGILEEEAWVNQESCLTIRFEVGARSILALYRRADGKPEMVDQNEKASKQSKSRNALLSIYYSYRDMSDTSLQDNPMYEERCLFTGICDETEDKVFGKIKEKLLEQKG